MSKLYPPYLNEVIPGFYGKKLKIPFTMNPAVSLADIAGFQVQFKNITKNKIENFNCSISAGQKLEDIVKKQYFYCNVETADKRVIPIGFYKLQIKYKSKKNGEDSDWSSPAIVKKALKPTVTIEALNKEGVCEYPHTFTGIYTTEAKDSGEKLYSSQFIIKRKDSKEIVAKSGWIQHNITLDSTSNAARETYTFDIDLQPSIIYQIHWTVKTSNGIVVSSSEYQIRQTNGLVSTIADYVDLEAQLDRDEGRMRLKLVPTLSYSTANSLKNEHVVVISRASRRDNYSTWSILKETKIKDINVNIFNDYSIEYGETYKYSIQTVEDSYYSARIISSAQTAYFDDMFLWDGKRQLKIKYNPKVSTYKPNILENKIETIGSKYPFFFRNGNVNYKEFQISGLLSYLTDNDHHFITEQEYKNYHDDNTDERLYSLNRTTLEDKNFQKEKFFKDYALKWLTNGKPKVFKSPSEGNNLVRLMNVSLSPNDTLNRMIYTFSCSAYEIGNYDINTLKEYSIISGISTGLQQKKLFEKSYSKTKGAFERAFDNSIVTDIEITNKISGTLAVSVNGGAETYIVGKNSKFIRKDTVIKSYRVRNINNGSFTFHLSTIYYKPEAKNIQVSTSKQKIYNSIPVDPKTNLVGHLKPKSTTNKKYTTKILNFYVKKRPTKNLKINFQPSAVGGSTKEQSIAAIKKLYNKNKLKLNYLYKIFRKDSQNYVGCAVLFLDDKKKLCVYYYGSSVVNQGTENLIKYNSSKYGAKSTYIISNGWVELSSLIGDIDFSYEDIYNLYINPGLNFKITYLNNTYK